MARIALLFALLTFAVALPAAAAEAAPVKCKKGYVLKKVKKNGKPVRKNGKIVKKCVKRKQAPATTEPAQDAPMSPAPLTGTPPAGGGTAPPAEPAQVRNDQALLDALTNAAFYKTYSGGGFGSYAYNFLPTVLTEVEGRKMYSLRYCTYYYAVGFTTDRSNYDGVWLIKEGYTHPADPGLVTGILQLWRQGMSQGEIVEAPVAVKGGEAAIKTGDGAKYFEPGDYAYKPGQATTDCSVWEPA